MIQEETEEPVIFGKFGTRIDNFVYKQEADTPMVLSDFTSDKKEVIAYGASMLVGGVAGVAVVGFEYLTQYVRHLGMDVWLPFVGSSEKEMIEIFAQLTSVAEPGSAWPVAILPLFGGVTITCIRLLNKNDLGVPLAALNKDPTEAGARIKPLKVVTKAGAAAITLGTANSLGPEGPVVELGGNVGVYLGRALGFRQEELRGFLAAGTAAGLAAGFNAPIAAIFFALELVLKGSVDKGFITMTLLSAVTAASVKEATLGLAPKFTITNDLSGLGLAELPMYLAVGALCGVMAFFFEWSTSKSRESFKKLADAGLPVEYHPLVGSAVMCATALFLPETLFLGYKGVSNLLVSPLEGWSTVGTLLLISPVKVIVTSIAAASGLVGGVFAPALFIGATTGAMAGTVAANLGLSETGLHLVSGSELYALIGMPAMLAAYIKAPLTSVLLLFEITRDYNVVVPVMAGVSMSVFINMQINYFFNPKSSGPSWLPNNSCRVLNKIPIVKAMVPNVVQLPISTSLLDAGRAMTAAQSDSLHLVVRGVVAVDADGKPKGAVTVETLTRKVGQISLKLKQSFEEINQDKSGEISLKEFKQLLQRISPNDEVSMWEAKQIFDFMDVDGSGRISFQEYFTGITRLGSGNTLQNLGSLLPNNTKSRTMSPVLNTDATLYDAAMAMHDLNTDCLTIVTPEGEVVGIIIEPSVKTAIEIAFMNDDLSSMTM
eukprot:CAMPEP_0198200858 /NCGR_PEP_ID=MMETSP1445-20131203/3767_1 /TAXON_ID=36898 /ORGANISM="Pyramimonas sp., Strain CCMP2087" /LENGTH=715 /DNA_ID=CAMNT_0043871019 /DNA_START=532 /DNA_END=2679 /DNA_ORIENTATION=-